MLFMKSNYDSIDLINELIKFVYGIHANILSLDT